MILCKEIVYKLDAGLLEEYIKGTLFVTGRILRFANKNNIFDVKILSFDGVNVRFEVVDENSTETWTIDNFYIFNEEHLGKLFDNAKEYDMTSSFPEWEGVEGVYILRDNENDNMYYVGQSIDIKRRMSEHLHGTSSCIDKRLHETKNFTVKFIRLEDSGYSNSDAFETAFIAYLKSFFCGYNRTRGNLAPRKERSKNIKQKLTVINAQ